MVKSVISIDFIAFKQAMRSGTKAAGKAKAYYIDYMENKINIETFYSALKELDKEHKFIVDGNMDNVICDIQYGIHNEVQSQFIAKLDA
ncbi:hypothetical protein [Butyrivibrio sp. M55]|jgi:hypothetical protein|uniref:hypothetical protein n=1 Tax=Butyrivibrio sp. M55 TaxID=1855323 RepID=UPI0008E65224|nr:hypothetical protein [Butyrivibrio sp. M55]SFU94492.1 hypothetical protein SAMN05216540_12521 [Butyrivibrio sp. M55]